MSIEDRVKQLAKSKGMKMSALAKNVGMSPSNLLSSIKSNPRLNTIENIALALGVGVADIVGSEKEIPEGLIVLNGETYVISKPTGKNVQVPHYKDKDKLKKDVISFIHNSIIAEKDGAICGYMGMVELFNLLYDSENKTFGLALCYGNGHIYTNFFPCIEYGDGNVWDEKEVIMSILSDVEGIVQFK